MLERMELLVDKDVINKLKSIRVLIVGIGGVGGACFEALVRMGISNISIVDNDVFSESNLNRQLLSNINNIGNFVFIFIIHPSLYAVHEDDILSE